MLFNYLIVVPFLFSSTLSVEVIKIRNKRSDIDLDTCINKFAIHKDMIIRTQDSRVMGANYLNEIDLDSREECLRLCCETENCDVFVYEEKNAGSCYLFQCGPPEDFKCKFTHHVNYTSGVLAVSRHMADLESQIKLTKHEQDLTKLRRPEVVTTGNMQIQTTQSTMTTTTKLKDIMTNVKTKTEKRKCSIYQFECRSTGECIAIYNACDGIPQCADGSDEAAELKCPDSLATLSPLQLQRENPKLESIKAPPEPTVFAPKPRTVYSGPVAQYPKMPISSRPEADFLAPSDTINMHPQAYEVPQYQQYNLQKQSWIPHQPNPPPYPQYPDKNSHIFNHKESGLQVAEVGESSQIQYTDGREYPMPNFYGPEVYGQQPQRIPDNWPNNQQDYRNGLKTYRPDNIPSGRETWNQNNPVADDRDKLVYTEQVKQSQEKVTSNHEQEIMAHELKHSKEHFGKADNNIEQKEHSADDGHDHGKYSVIAEYKMAETIEAIEDGVAETPGGAVLSLTLGLIITSLMGILIGCRLRVVRKRLRRGGKSFAHDADYLVNGMYL